MRATGMFQVSVTAHDAHGDVFRREEAKIPVTVVRYEDLRNDGPSQLERIIDLIVPKENRPSRRRLECATQPDPQKEPYRSKKYPIFSAWHRYDNETRAWMFEIVKDEW